MAELGTLKLDLRGELAGRRKHQCRGPGRRAPLPYARLVALREPPVMGSQSGRTNRRNQVTVALWCLRARVAGAAAAVDRRTYRWWRLARALALLHLASLR